VFRTLYSESLVCLTLMPHNIVRSWQSRN